MLNKLKQSIKQSQEVFKSDYELEKYIREKCTIADLHVINKYTEQTNIFGRIYITDETLADGKIKRETANRRKRKLHDDGVHFARQTNQRKPTVVYQHPFFFKPSFRKRIKDIIPAAANIPKIALLLAVTINNAITGKIDNVSKVTPFKEASPIYIRKLSLAYEEEDKQRRKIYKDANPLTNRKPPDYKVDSLNKNKEQLLQEIKNYEDSYLAMLKVYEANPQWPRHALQPIEKRIAELKEQYARAN